MILIGIAGGSASGKSTFAKIWKEQIYPDTTILPVDNYYRTHNNLNEEELNRLNYDEPQAIDHSLLYQQLKELRSGNTINCPCYDFATHSRSETCIPVTPSEIILIEGIMTFHWPEIRKLFDYLIFIDSSEEVRYHRRLKRDIQERGRDSASVYSQWEASAQPGYKKFCYPTREYAHFIINGELPEEGLIKSLPESLKKLLPISLTD